MTDTRDTIIDATMALIAERPLADVTPGAIAAEAGVSLADLQRHFTSRMAILAAFSARVDQSVLAGDHSDMVDESPRDRLFDILMARLDALSPYRAALAALMRAVRRDPELALALNGIAMRSQAWMLAAAGVSPRGLRGKLAVQSLVVGFAQVLRVFLSEDDPGLPRTMAALDKELRTLEARHNRLARIFGSALGPEAAPAAAPAAAPPQPAAPAPPDPEPVPPPVAAAAPPAPKSALPPEAGDAPPTPKSAAPPPAPKAATPQKAAKPAARRKASSTAKPRPRKPRQPKTT